VVSPTPVRGASRLAPRTVADVLRAIEAAMPLRAGTTTTVDRIIVGNAEVPLTGIITTMFPTMGVLREAVARRANLLVVHEPTFNQASDDVSALDGDPVYAKSAHSSNGTVL
jgi:putative NIF3 family GTP cyclohydrolase 1 type 2